MAPNKFLSGRSKSLHVNNTRLVGIANHNYNSMAILVVFLSLGCREVRTVVIF